MRQLLFAAFRTISLASLTVIDFLYSKLAMVHQWIYLNLREAVSAFFYYLMKWLAPEEVEAVEAQVKDKAITVELGLLNAATLVRDNAMLIGSWEEEHTIALESIANALLNDCGWDEVDIHSYLKEVVEVVPGIDYGFPEE